VAGGPVTAGELAAAGELAPAGELTGADDGALLTGGTGALLAGALGAAAEAGPAVEGDVGEVACGLEPFVHPANASDTDAMRTTDDKILERDN
jgi:hypothetical protein